MKRLLVSILAILLCLSAFTLIACNGDDSTTINKTVPTFEIIDPVAYKSSVEFEIAESDPDNIGEIISIELYKGDSKIKTAENMGVRRFEGLDSNTVYTVKVKYAYDLQNGEGKKVGEISAAVKTMAGYSSSNDIKRDWSGKTLNIACSSWNAEPKAPWSVIELCVDYGKESGFGTKIDAAVLERQEYIKETYGVDLNWINATRYNMHTAIDEAIIAGNIYYDIALPRAMRVQSIVANGSVYDLANRDYIDFSNPYYDKNSVETYTAKGHTFFVDGDFSYISRETAHVLYFNKSYIEGPKELESLYESVRNGTWTYDKLVNMASSFARDDGDRILENNELLGMTYTSHTLLFNFFGASRASVNKETGEWQIALKNGKQIEIVDRIIELITASWASNGSNKSIFENAETLFFQGVIQDAEDVCSENNTGILPFPMLDTEQGRYYAPNVTYYTVLMCIPKNTQDRNMSEYFLDVLAWTGNEYMMKAYLDAKSEYISDVDMEMLVDYVFPNVTYDPGAAVGWGSIMSEMSSSLLYKGGSNKDYVNNFDKVYAEGEPEALEVIAEWNKAWGAYTEN